ncbi:hypothetical protein [Paludibaculum fermentans]|uniref:Uncharacterized protein n=1 Tax=Paludibaculum fermentans TaxID=1473598 RepID=A0A7S7SKG2_PALFE|nr:hypothetical protein [Paludibaculum fermentans]QOY89122.1 hypothetical protein IRI77_03950 [Paludibaculum fermentans]
MHIHTQKPWKPSRNFSLLLDRIQAWRQAAPEAKQLIDRAAKHYAEKKEFLVEYRRNQQTLSALAINADGTLKIKAANFGDRLFSAESGNYAFPLNTSP